MEKLLKIERTKVHYVIISGGDGSAYPSFVESKKLAEWIEMHESEQGEGFTEAAGWLSYKSDSPVKFDNVETKESYYLENLVGEWTNLSKESTQNYIDTFFSGTRPTFEIRDSVKEAFVSLYGDKDEWFYVDVYCKDEFIKTEMYKKGRSRKKILKELNENFYDLNNNKLE